jgi:hypothetical protein
MSRNDKSSIVIAVGLNTLFALGLVSWMSWRLANGQSPFPPGATPVVMGLCAVVPIVCVCFANFLRWRRNAA